MAVKYKKAVVDFGSLAQADIFYYKSQKMVKCVRKEEPHNAFVLTGENKGKWFGFAESDKVKISQRKLLDDPTIDADEEDDADSVEYIET